MLKNINLPDKGDKERIVILGAGFAGLTLARRLSKAGYQIVLIDKNNYHQFQPLFYQVAMAGLEPSSIVFPLRRAFQKNRNVFIRVTRAEGLDLNRSEVITGMGTVSYDHLIIATGAVTNFFGNERIQRKAIPMKSISEALYLRNIILEDYEKAIITEDFEERQGLIDILIVGGGPTGVEVAGALAEMRKFILPKDYQEIDIKEIDIVLAEGADRVLPAMSEEASAASEKFLEDLGVKVKTNIFVKDYDGRYAQFSNGEQMRTNKVIWAAGVRGEPLKGLPKDMATSSGRLKVDAFLKVKGTQNIYAVGDVAYLEEKEYPRGHPQVAPVAMQQAKHLARNLKNRLRGKEATPFSYHDKGSMATIGRSRAVVDLPQMKLKGFIAWVIWMVVHLFQLIGVKNRLFVFINWIWSYLLYDQSLRLIIRPRIKPYMPDQTEEEGTEYL